MNHESNSLLWGACLSNGTEQIGTFIQTHHVSINMTAFLGFFRDIYQEREELLERDADSPESSIADDDWLTTVGIPFYINIPSEAAIALALEAYKPFAYDHHIGSMFKCLCENAYPQGPMRAFIKLYASRLTSKALANGLYNACMSIKLACDTYPFTEIVEVCMDKIGKDAYWSSLVLCCIDYRPDLVERMIKLYGHPISPADPFLNMGIHYVCRYDDAETARLLLNKYGSPICEILLRQCGETGELGLVEMVFGEYTSLLTIQAVTIGFRSACNNRDPDMINMYVDFFGSMVSSHADAIQESCRGALKTAVALGADEVVELLLGRCMHVLWFEKGSRAGFDDPRGSLAPKKVESDEDKVERRAADERIKEMLKGAYGPRLTIAAAVWIVRAEE